MIRELFLPETLFGKRIISQRTLGFSIEHDVISMAQVYATPRKTVIELLARQPITPKGAITDPEAARDGIAALMTKAGKFDKIRIAIPAALAVFKELTMPFANPEKIRMVIDYELEPMLPFPIDEAIVDFIVTKQPTTGAKQTRVLAAAVRTADLEDVIKPYALAGIEPHHLTIDVLSLYDLYKQIPAYSAIKDGSSIVDMGSYSTRVTFLQDGQFRLVRTIQQGIRSIARNISQELNIKEDEAFAKLKKLNARDTSKGSFNQTAQQHIINFFHDVQFNLNSFTMTLNFYRPINKILFTGTAWHINDLMPLASNVLQTPCELFNPKKILRRTITHTIKRAHVNWEAFARPLGTALPAPGVPVFDLRRKAFALPRTPLMRKQLYTGMTLVLGMMCIIGWWGYLQISNLTALAHSIKQNELRTIKKFIKRDYSDITDPGLARLVQRALRDKRLHSFYKNFSTLVREEETSWLDIAKRRLNPLHMLHNLIKAIDRETFTLTIKELNLSIVEGVPQAELSGLLKPKTEGQDYREWQQFEHSLEDKPGKPSLFVKKESEPGEPLPEGGVQFSLTLRKKEKRMP